MWQNSGFHGHGNYQQPPQTFEQIEQSQENYQQAHGGGDGFIPFSPVPPGPEWFSQQLHSDLLPYGAGFGEQASPVEVLPEADVYNTSAFMHNQFIASDGQEPFRPSQLTPIQSPSNSKPAISARAQVLRAQLKKSQELRARSATPPVIARNSGVRCSKPVDSTSSPGDYLQTSDESSNSRPSSMDVDDLIMSEAKAAVNASANLDRAEKTLPTTIHSKSKTSPMVNYKSIANGRTQQATPAKVTAVRSSTDDSEESEGEIKETLAKSQPPTGPKDTQVTERKKNLEEHVLRKPRAEEMEMASRTRDGRPLSPNQPSPIQSDKLSPLSRKNSDLSETIKSGKAHSQPSNRREDRLLDRGVEKDNYEGKSKDFERSRNKTKHEAERQHEIERKPYHKELHKHEDPRKHEIKYETKMEKTPVREPEIPTLARLLEFDEDLKDWLLFTEYHNNEYRSKFLNRRRALAALDVQKAKIMEEIDLEEKRGTGLGVGPQTIPVTMPPPPIPAISCVSTTTQSADIPGRLTNECSTPSTQENLKRSYSDYHDSNRAEEKHGKDRDDGVRDFKVKRLGDFEDWERRLQSSGYGPSSRHSQGDSRSRNEDRNSSPHRGENPEHPHGYSTTPDMSSGLQTYESRPPARKWGVHDTSFEEYYDRDDWKKRRAYDESSRGGYKVRGYDPNYRGRGRGRGRGCGRGDSNGSHDHRPMYGQRIANGKPYKNPEGFDNGGKGDTRYFIVKSFNEDNVLRCIEDSIWTTQVQNGDMFKEAFLTCKNVVLVFSINQSRAFQGYARMENIPGSEAVPPWQNSIQWESAGAFKVKWLTIASTRFQRVGHLKNRLNDNLAVLIGKDGQEIEEHCGAELVKLIDEEADHLLTGSPVQKFQRYRQPGVSLDD